MRQKLFKFVRERKIISSLVLIALVAGGYFGWQKIFPAAEIVRYVTAKVTRGALISSISGTGQVSASNQLDIKTKASGNVTFVGAKVGDEVKAGTLLLQIDASDALKSIRDAEASLESAKLSYEKFIQPADAFTIMQAENSLVQAKESRQQAVDDLEKAYEDGFNNVSNVFLDLPAIKSGLDDMLYGNSLDSLGSNVGWFYNMIINYSLDSNKEAKAYKYKNEAEKSYNAARNSYDKNFDDYKSVSRVSDSSTMEALILETYNTVKLIADAVKNINNYIDFTQYAMEQSSENVSIPSAMTTYQKSLDSYTGTTNSHLLNLLSAKNSIEDSENSIVSAERSVNEKTASLAELKAGADPLDIKTQQISLKQKENSLIDAREKLADYSIRAPFDGVVAALDLKKGDEVSSGTAAATLITKQRVATITLNEVDVAKVKAGQKATVTFDAIEDLSITGEVVEVDALGTVSQGVVSYDVKIVFDVQDERVKPGMSVSVSIILSSKPDVLLVSSSAIKTQNGENYIEVLINGAPQKKAVTAGDSNDTMTEITSGLAEGDEVVTQTVTGGSSASAGSSGSSQSGSRNSGPPGGMMFLRD